jgi:hypothetical protein
LNPSLFLSPRLRASASSFSSILKGDDCSPVLESAQSESSLKKLKKEDAEARRRGGAEKKEKAWIRKYLRQGVSEPGLLLC